MLYSRRAFKKNLVRWMNEGWVLRQKDIVRYAVTVNRVVRPVIEDVRESLITIKRS